MKALSFPQHNCVFAEDQPEYQPLPALRTGDGAVLSCWGLSLRERIRLLFAGRLWLWVLTYGDPLQPVALQVDDPFKVPQ